MESQLFAKRLNSLNKPQKIIDLEKKLEKFKVIEKQNMEKGAREEQELREKERQIKEEMRKIQLNKLQRNITFMEDWQEKGRKEWEKNQKIKHDREERERAFSETMAQRKAMRETLQRNAERDEAIKGIQEFEQNASKLGVEVDHDPENRHRIERSTYSVSATIMKLKDKSLQSEQSRKERDKR